MQLHGQIRPAQLAPVGDLASEQAGQLRGVQGLHGIVRVHHDGQAVDRDDLFGLGAAHVA
ncbi:hypothetical protein D3C77_682000 [compost metagenome]